VEVGQDLLRDAEGQAAHLDHPLEALRRGPQEGVRGHLPDRNLFGKVDVRLPGKGNSNSHGARPVHLIITMSKWIRTSRRGPQEGVRGHLPDRNLFPKPHFLGSEREQLKRFKYFYLTAKARNWP